MADGIRGAIGELTEQIDAAVFLKMQEAVTTNSEHGILIEWPADIFTDERSEDNTVLLNGPTVSLSAEVPRIEVHERHHGQTEQVRSRTMEFRSMHAFVQGLNQ